MDTEPLDLDRVVARTGALVEHIIDANIALPAPEWFAIITSTLANVLGLLLSAHPEAERQAVLDGITEAAFARLAQEDAKAGPAVLHLPFRLPPRRPH